MKTRANIQVIAGSVDSPDVIEKMQEVLENLGTGVPINRVLKKEDLRILRPDQNIKEGSKMATASVRQVSDTSLP